MVNVQFKCKLTRVNVSLSEELQNFVNSIIEKNTCSGHIYILLCMRPALE